MSTADFWNTLRYLDSKVFVCGTGIAMALTGSHPEFPEKECALTWAQFVKRYEEEAEKLLGPRTSPEATQQLGSQLSDYGDKASRIVNRVNRKVYNGHDEHEDINTSPLRAKSESLEIHRLIAQRIIRPWKCHGDFVSKGEILNNFGAMILTTNYDTLIEEAIPERFSISHTEALTYLRENVLEGTMLGGVGQLQDPKKLFVIHIHGRYYDFGREHGFTLTKEEYVHKEACEKFLAFMEPIAKENSMIFIGAEGTIEDYHFQQLWSKLKRGNNEHTHYVLVRNSKVEDINTMIKRLKLEGLVQAIGCGDTHDDLWRQLKHALPVQNIPKSDRVLRSNRRSASMSDAVFAEGENKRPSSSAGEEGKPVKRHKTTK